MFKKRLGIILMLICILTTTATEAFAAEEIGRAHV